MRFLAISVCLFLGSWAWAQEDQLEEIQIAAQLLDKAFKAESREDAMRFAADGLDRLDRIESEHKEDTRYHIMRGYMLGNFLGKPNEAVKALARAIKLDPKNPEPYFVAGETLYYDGQFERAAQMLVHAAQRNPEHTRSALLLGKSLTEIGNLDLARKQMGIVLTQEPENTYAKRELARIYALQENHAESAAAYGEEAEKFPEDMDLAFNLAQSLYNAEQYEKALATYIRVAEKFPSDYHAISKIIQIQNLLGNQEERDKWTEKIYALYRSEAAPKALKEQKFFICDQFKVGDFKIFAFEFFDLEGEVALKYRLRAYKTNAEGKREEVNLISLGSYEQTNKIAQELGETGPDERRFHLDLYAPGDYHETLGFFNGNPGYDEVKRLATARWEGKLKALSSSEGSTINLPPVPKEEEEN